MAKRELPVEIKNLISFVLDHFTAEAKRLHDPSVLLESRDLLNFLFTSMKQIGGIQHESALHALAEQLEIVRREAKANRSSIWKKFSILLKRKRFRVPPEIASALSDVRNLKFRGNETDDPEMREQASEFQEQLRTVVQAAEASIKSEKELEKLGRQLDRTLVAFDVQMHIGTYTRLALQKLLSFLGKHTFIILVSVLLFGLGYSWLVRQSQTLMTKAFGVGIWGLVFFAFVAAFFKEYVVGKKIKSLRLRAERWLLLPVLERVFYARLYGLMRAAWDRQPARSTNSKKAG